MGRVCAASVSGTTSVGPGIKRRAIRLLWQECARIVSNRGGGGQWPEPGCEEGRRIRESPRGPDPAQAPPIAQGRAGRGSPTLCRSADPAPALVFRDDTGLISTLGKLRKVLTILIRAL